MDERTAWLTLSLWGGTLARPVREALAHGVAPQDLVEGRVPSQRLAAVLRKRPRVSVPNLLADLGGLAQRALTPADDEWPRARLAALADPPPALFVQGALPLVGKRAVAVVGTRAATPYGTDLARALGQELAAAGVDVVSGLALGIDHQPPLQDADRAFEDAHVLVGDKTGDPGLAKQGFGKRHRHDIVAAHDLQHAASLQIVRQRARETGEPCNNV